MSPLPPVVNPENEQVQLNLRVTATYALYGRDSGELIRSSGIWSSSAEWPFIDVLNGWNTAISMGD